MSVSDTDEVLATVDRMLREREQAATEIQPTGMDRELWAQLEEYGFAQAGEIWAADESGAGFGTAAAIVTRCGYYGARIPLAEALLSIPTAIRYGCPGGRTGLTAVAVADGPGRVDGIKWSDCAAELLIVRPVEGRTELTLAATADVCFDMAENLAGEPVASIDTGFLARGTTIRIPGRAAYDRMRLAGALGATAQSLGCLYRVRDLCITYCRSRIQFGRPIGRFQAVQRLMADLTAEIALVAAAFEMAVSVWSATFQDDAVSNELVAAVATAKSRSASAATAVARIAHQIHGAIGVTTEFGLDHFTRRLLAWRDEYGDELQWHRQLVNAVSPSTDGLLSWKSYEVRPGEGYEI
jgi:acyl-CoA dehydrogenase